MKTISVEKLLRENKRLKREVIYLKKEKTSVERFLKLTELRAQNLQEKLDSKPIDPYTQSRS